MAKNFWEKLKKPIMILAPMADVTDAAFRELITKYGKPDVMWTEFVSADGLCSKEGREHLMIDFKYSEAERPIVAQLFSGKPEKMYEAAKLVSSLGFDGVDINMGCPDRSVEKQCAGAYLMKNPKLAKEIIEATKEGAPDLPVSVKTRIGYNKNEIDTWVPNLLETDIAVLTIHARTRKEMSKVPARWEHIKEVVDIRNDMGVKTLIVGNGDVVDLYDAGQKAKEYNADGVMLGRGIFGNPWLFAKNKKEKSTEEKLNVLIQHTKLFDKYFNGVKSFAVMKKHFKAYVIGFDGAKELRMELMETQNSQEVGEIINRFLNK